MALFAPFFIHKSLINKDFFYFVLKLKINFFWFIFISGGMDMNK